MGTSKKEQEEREFLTGWVDIGNGVQATKSPRFIHQALNLIKHQHLLCNLVTRGYESGQTILLDFSPDLAQWDRPADWPEKLATQALRIIFRDRTGTCNQLVSHFIRAADDTLITTVPAKYISLQRRQSYRVSAPEGSRISFRHRGGEREHFRVADISADGCQFSVEGAGEDILVGLFYHEERKELLAMYDPISEISLVFPVSDGVEIQIRIDEGRIRRIFYDKKRNACLVGIHFLVKPWEERALFAYVRQRERELLRRGLTDLM